MPNIKFGPRVTNTLVLPKTVCYVGHATVSQASPCTTRPRLAWQVFPHPLSSWAQVDRTVPQAENKKEIEIRCLRAFIKGGPWFLLF